MRIYCSPSEDLKLPLFFHIFSTYKHYVVFGDFNAQSTHWYCKTSSSKGTQLEDIASKFNIYIPKLIVIPTYQKSGNIIDLALISESLSKTKHLNRFFFLSTTSH